MILHTVGVIGLLSEYKELFLKLTSINLLISFIIVLLNQKEKNKHFILFCCIVFDLGFIIELIGVKTGFIFGNYNYGETLGFKLFDIPLIIGINWLLLIYCTGVMIEKVSENSITKSTIGALLLVFLDLLIEPVAIKYDFWAWENGIIPLQNYVAWFLISFIFLIIFNKLNFGKNNFVAKIFLAVQLIFFIVLNCV